MSDTTQSANAGVNTSTDVHEALLIDGTDVQTKLGSVAKFHQDGDNNNLDENIVLDDIDNYKNPKDNNDFVGLTVEELQQYINDKKWKRIRYLIAFLYIALLVLLLIGAVVLIIRSPACAAKSKRWHEKDIIYEVDVTTFYDSNGNGVGDIKGIEEQLDYFRKNNIKSILLQSSLFNVTSGTSPHLDGTVNHGTNLNLLHIDSSVGTEDDLKHLLKILHRKDMHLIIDLPLSSILDPSGELWYGSTKPLPKKIDNPCKRDENSLGCRYYKAYGRLPLDFNDGNILKEAKHRLDYWLSTKKVDGVRVDLPLYFNESTNMYQISFDTIDEWNKMKNDIEQKTKPKLLLMDIPFALQELIKSNNLNKNMSHPLFIFKNQTKPYINAKSFNQRLRSFSKINLSLPKFWQLGSKRRSDDVGIVQETQLPREMVLTTTMLLGGTPIVLYGEEIGLDQKSFPLMPWKSDGQYRGFSSCSNLTNCKSFILSSHTDFPVTSVKRQEASGGESKDSLLKVFRRLSKLRQQESFQFGSLNNNYDDNSNIFWFVRKADGYRGYVTVLNLNNNLDEIAHVSLHELTNGLVPTRISYEYQWPKAHFQASNETNINADNLLIHPRSINIFSWA